jgi:iron complex outermembrane recepter protein
MGFHKNQRDKLFKKSLLALCVMAVAAPTFAQDDDAVEEAEEVVVTGMRQAMSSAQDIKRNSATVVDSITADDVGSFPDKSVAEALQRVAGITVSRFAAANDTAHFSAEPSQVVVRGLNQVRTEFNGRDSFSANASRGLSWGDISPELMAGVDTYKNQMAELIEGGIAGTVNMRTRLPFDQSGQMTSVTISANYGDLSEELGPELSGLFSNRWETGVGEFGVLASLASSDVTTRSQGNQMGAYLRYRDIYGDTTGRPTLSNEELFSVYRPIGVEDGFARNQRYHAAYGENGYKGPLVYIPNSMNMRDNTYERERTGVSLAAQWKDLDDVLEVALQYNRSEYENNWEEYVITLSTPGVDAEKQSVFKEHFPQNWDPNANNGAGGVSDFNAAPRPLNGTPDFTFDNNGLFQTGVMTADLGWWGGSNDDSKNFAQNAAGQQLVNACYGWNGCSPARRALDLTTVTRYSTQVNMTQDLGLNVKWNISDSARAVFDVQYIDSTVENYDIEAGFNTFTNAALDFSGRPIVALSAPLNVNFTDATGSPLTNGNNYRIQHIMDHIEDSEGNELALRADFEFDVDSGWIESVKVGGRYADREQLVRWTKYNWHNVSNTWTAFNAPYYNLDRHTPADVMDGGNLKFKFNGYPTGYYVPREFQSDYHDLSTDSSLGGNNQFLFWDINLLKDRERLANGFGAQSLGMTAGIGWDPLCSGYGDRSGEIDGTCFRPSEIVDVSEEVSALYAQVDFGGDDATVFGFPVSGNLGIRVVRTTNMSSGGVDFPEIAATDLECRTDQKPVPVDTDNDGIPDSTQLQSVQSVGCFLSPDDRAFANGGYSAETIKVNHTNVLPSFNIKFDLNDEWLTRLAISKAMARPDIGNMKNYTGIGISLPNDPSDPGFTTDPVTGLPNGVVARYSASGQNPYLEPIEAKQIDVTLEHYWSDTGSFTMTAFYKDFDNYIQSSSYVKDFTNNGVTKTMNFSQPVNGDGASIHGFEIAYQTFFDSLPEPFDGLGVQANYTRIYNNGIANSNVRSLDAGDPDSGGNATSGSRASDIITIDRLEGLSDHGANLVGMYEKGDWALRLAYSWRSEYVVTAIDCCVLRPIWTEASGQLDGSIRYHINDNIEVSLQGSNLLNEETVTTMQLENDSDGGLRAPYGWFQNDRRYTLTMRLKY